MAPKETENSVVFEKTTTIKKEYDERGNVVLETITEISKSTAALSSQ